MTTEGCGPTLYAVMSCLSKAVDLVSPAVRDHHFRVAYMVREMGRALDLPEETLGELVLAGLVHDVGALSLSDDLAEFHFDLEAPHLHASMGTALLREYRPLMRSGDLVLHHHVPWDGGRGQEHEGAPVAMGSHLLHLAERVAGLINDDAHILGQATLFADLVRTNEGRLFNPAAVETFRAVSGRESFWLALTSRHLEADLARTPGLPQRRLDHSEVQGLTRLLCRVIDFRSPYTYTHSSGVAAVAETMGRLMALDLDTCADLEVAGYMHDLGKLAVPRAILEKQGRLTAAEYDIVKGHPFYSRDILQDVAGLGHIALWAGAHHERPDGQGYPFRLKDEDIPLEARILQAGDVFTAVTEDRPYRAGMSGADALSVLDGMAGRGAMDGECVSLLHTSFDAVDHARRSAQQHAAEAYASLRRAG